MKREVFEYIGIILLASLLGFLIIKRYATFQEPTPMVEGDFSNYIKEEPIVLYSTSWCPKCKQTIEYFNKRNISFENRDIEKFSQWKSDFIALKASGIPLVVTPNRVFFGFKTELFDKFILAEL